jgi:hypothetical protein
MSPRGRTIKEGVSDSINAGPTLARTKQQPLKNEQEDFHVKTSISLFGEDELRQLQQLKESSSNDRSSILELLQKHPREAFLLFTLILAIMVYFYYNKHAFADDVT